MATRKKVHKNNCTRKKCKHITGGNNEDIPCGKNANGDLTKCPPNHRCEMVNGVPLCKSSVEIKLSNGDASVTLIVPWKRHEKWLKHTSILNTYIADINTMRTSRDFNRTRLNKDNKELMKNIDNADILQMVSGANNSDELIIQSILLKHFTKDTDTDIETQTTTLDEKKSLESPIVEDEPSAVTNQNNNDTETNKELNVKLSELQNNMNMVTGDVDSKEYNTSLNANEKLHHDYLKNEPGYDFLYPELDDPNFNIKIAKRKEFFDTQYDGTIHDVKSQAEKMCNVKFELLPHQLFVKNFMSIQTPYNGLLLYHGLGTGKTCSAIGISEEMRSYIKNIGSTHRIMVIASPNVQSNFMMQLFDDRKLEQVGGVWNLDTCVGNELLKELNPLQLQNIPKDKVISQIKQIIKLHYKFMGYGEFANYIKKKTMVDENLGLTAGEKIKQEIHNIREIFNNRLIIIDEVHNISAVQTSKQNAKKTSAMLMHICKYAENMRLLLLSATPMYNSYREIIWLTNLLNIIDRRALIREEDVFDKDGNFLEPRKTKDGRDLEGGKELLRRKLTGYVSYVRGENPYTFPYRVYPELFDDSKTITPANYPKLQMNKKPIETPLTHLPVYTNSIGNYQSQVYEFIMNNLRTKAYTTSVQGNQRILPTFDNMESFGYTLLSPPIQSLNIVYPNMEFDDKMIVATKEDQEESNETDMTQENSSPVANQLSSLTNSVFTGGDDSVQVTEEDDAQIENNSSLIDAMVGSRGLSNVFTYKVTNSPYMLRHSFEYKPEIIEKYGRILTNENIGKYSSKIHNICNIVKKSKGIVMIYSQYIDSGVVPIALALEEMGFSRFGTANYTKSLFNHAPTEPINSTTMQTKSEYMKSANSKKPFKPAKYVMITGDKFFSPNNADDLKLVTRSDNKYGENVKVILITKAAAEGLDFKNIRQLHILEPWYNASRIEQIIGRSVRNLSHCALPFEERNVEIYLHASKTDNNAEEAADMYIYRYAENKAIQIGKITRILKETAIDCILNVGQSNFTLESMTQQSAGQKIQLSLSSSPENKTIEYEVGDKPFTELCDYMDTCNYVCNPTVQLNENELYKNTYNEQFAKMNFSAIVKRIRELFREQTFYDRTSLINNIALQRNYPVEHIDYALTNIVENKNEHIIDKYGRYGYLINKDKYYVFQPFEITDEHASIYEREIPIDIKHEKLNMELPVSKNEKKDIQKIQKPKEAVTIEDATTNKKQRFDTLFAHLKTQIKYIDKERIIQTKMKDTYKDLGKINKRSLSQLREQYRDDTIPVDWYKNAGIIYDILTEKYFLPKDVLNKIFVHHYLDTLDLPSHKLFIEHLYYGKVSDEIVTTTDDSNLDNELIKNSRLYYDKLNMEVKDKTAILIPDEDTVRLYSWNKESKTLEEGQPTDYIRFESTKQTITNVSSSKINNIFGFMYPFKKDIVFKLKTHGRDKNNAGTTCDKLGKIDILQRFMPILIENPHNITDWPEYNSSEFNNILKPGLCVLLECIMRYYNESSVEKVWFLDTTRALSNKISNL